MILIHDPAAMQAEALRLRAAGRRIAFVPTMGALHAGHFSLVDEARRRGDIVVVSVFVNPTQFGPKEDFSKYPRTLEADAEGCRAHGADILFAPSPATMYAKDASTFIEEQLCSAGFCGEFRPGHFRGVATVVAMLFNLVQPHVAIFGAKDAQQCAVIRKMVADLFIPVEIVVADTIREADGLALSSRNRYLSSEARAKAPALYAALRSLRDTVAAGERDAATLKTRFAETLAGTPGFELQYIGLCDSRTMRPADTVEPGRALALVAARLENTRLIDNLPL